MRLRKPAVAVAFATTALLTVLGPQAVAVAAPWETSKTPTTAQGTTSTAAGSSGTLTVRCAPPCYQ